MKINITFPQLIAIIDKASGGEAVNVEDYLSGINALKDSVKEGAEAKRQKIEGLISELERDGFSDEETATLLDKLHTEVKLNAKTRELKYFDKNGNRK